MASFRLGINEIRRAFYKDTKIGFAQIQNLKIYHFFLYQIISLQLEKSYLKNSGSWI